MEKPEPFPFATVDELKERWPDLPPGAEDHATVLLKDASQFILDVCPEAAQADPASRLRVACAVVRRSMTVPDHLAGLSSGQETTGGVSRSWTPSNPHGDFYLTKTERRSLGAGRSRAFSVQIAGFRSSPEHRPWCSLAFGATYCSCGADIAGEPIYER
ncbi:phage Gp19/Gp15/Gp42 family protein [Nesterenkonia massiliensis]|uniref:Phage Gp19/Gp15/Gp42 family protein n=1 Tax=Nesterenkonia massiliensis TaxID=1232429 RepID=A0ABT2HRI8_9MICC|nr:phage Gp19/Gp15/Gp42 family protein [Nesterenkonia massiliensis]MCT1607160.1 phage Gp19/Gp15/Gp42 family protein [Nesterenkonia massiliensis]